MDLVSRLWALYLWPGVWNQDINLSIIKFVSTFCYVFLFLKLIYTWLNCAHPWLAECKELLPYKWYHISCKSIDNMPELSNLWYSELSLDYLSLKKIFYDLLEFLILIKITSCKPGMSGLMDINKSSYWWVLLLYSRV